MSSDAQFILLFSTFTTCVLGGRLYVYVCVSLHIHINLPKMKIMSTVEHWHKYTWINTSSYYKKIRPKCSEYKNCLLIKV